MNPTFCYPGSLLDPHVSIYSVPNILHISLLGPSTNLRPTHSNLSRISLPHPRPDQTHVNKLRYCRGLLAGLRAEVVGVMEIHRRPVIIETINKRVYLDHWVATGRPLRFTVIRRAFVQSTRSFFGHCEFRRAAVGYLLRSSGLCNRVCVPRSSLVLRWRSAAVILSHTQPNHSLLIPPNHTHTWPRSVVGLRQVHRSEW
jgi:hypothetical protein